MAEPDFSPNIGYEGLVRQKFADASNVIEAVHIDFMYGFYEARAVSAEEYIGIVAAAWSANNALGEAEILNHDYSLDLGEVVGSLRRKCRCINNIRNEFSGDKRQVV